ncbi:hypothetical protein CIB48_g6892 [Xylaria polymorpha]|nr:hypothetical protein CIB48_g6892 [Xylaria polymorpha]
MATKSQRPKLPVQQLAILAVARFAEPLAMTSVYPYLPEMIASFGVERKDVAKWAGATSAVFSLAQSVTAVPWGRASDTFVWGMSTSLTMLSPFVAFKAHVMETNNGGRNGPGPRTSTNGILHHAFSLEYRSVRRQLLLQEVSFRLAQHLRRHRFPSLLVDGDTIPERDVAKQATFPRLGPHPRAAHHRGIQRNPLRRQQKLRRYSLQDAELAPLLQADGTSPRAARCGTRFEKRVAPSMSAVFTRQTVINLVAYTFLALHSVAFDQVLPVFLNYPQQEHTPENTFPPLFFSGGFGLNSRRIGTIFTFYGIISGAIQFLLFPLLCARFGVLKCFRVCVLTFPIVYFVLPFTVLIEDVKMRYGLLMALMVVKAFAVIVGFPCSTILLTNSAASLSILGTLNGFATTFSALGRASGPALAGVAFSWGVKNNMIGVPWWILGIIAAVGAFPVWMIVEGEGPKAESEDSSDAEDTDDTRVEEDAIVFDDDDGEDLPGGPSGSHNANNHEQQGLIQKGAKDTHSTVYGTIR